MKGLLDFLHSVVFELVGSGDVLLGPVNVLLGVPAPDHHNVLSLLLFLEHRANVSVTVQTN